MNLKNEKKRFLDGVIDFEMVQEVFSTPEGTHSPLKAGS
jgi:hypothetical protein